MTNMKRKILVIEDELAILDNVIQALSLEGFDVRGAPNGLIGVQMARVFLPDLIICDINMPELNGYGTLLELRNDPATAQIPFMFLTARADRADMRKGMEMGADDYLIKPFSNSELLAAARARLGRQMTITHVYERKIEELRNSMILSLPHEMRTPLTGVIGYAEMLMMDFEGTQNEQAQGMVQAIYHSGLRLHHVIEHYLLYAQIEMLLADPERSAAMRQSHMTNSLEVIPQQAACKASDYNRESDFSQEVADVNLPIERENLAKIVQEVVDNAFKFSEPGRPVHLAAEVEAHQFVMIVTDHGRGMTAEQIGNIGAYMQFDRNHYEQQGMGLGLIIARRLTELYGGQLTVTSKVNEGTTVWVTLPL